MRLTPRLLPVAIALATFGASAPAAQASGVLSDLLGPCTPTAVSQPFLPWADLASYESIPGGGFEPGQPAWSSTGNVSTDSSNEPWQVGGAGDGSSLVIADGASITSPAFCGGLAYPTLRLFAKSADDTSLPLALVSVRYPAPGGLVATLPLGLIAPGTSWQPTLTALTASGIPLLTGTQLAVQITALRGAVAVDDAYVDPFYHR
jgi:hypothetical protein